VSFLRVNAPGHERRVIDLGPSHGRRSWYHAHPMPTDDQRDTRSPWDYVPPIELWRSDYGPDAVTVALLADLIADVA